MKFLESRIGQHHYRVLRGMTLVALFVLVGKIAGAFKEIILAWRYGIGSDIDVYVFALIFVMWLPSIAASVLNSVLVPAINRLGAKDQQEFLAELTGATFVLALVVFIVLVVFVPLFLPHIATGFSDSAKNSLSSIVRFLAPVGALKFFVSLYSSQLLAQEKHANTLLEALPHLILGVTILVWPVDAGFWPLVVGTLIGVFFQVVVLYFFLIHSSIKPSIAFGFSHSVWKGFFKALVTISVGTIVMSFLAPIDQVLASQLGDGSIATFNYANRLLALVVGLGATAIARAILPVLSDNKINMQQRARLALKWSCILLILGVAAVLITWYSGPLAVSIMFERGAFTAQDTYEVAKIFQFSALQLPFYFASIVLVQYYASIGGYRLIALSSCLSVIVKLTAGPYLVSIMGLTGLALSTVLVYVVNFVLFNVTMLYRDKSKNL